MNPIFPKALFSNLHYQNISNMNKLKILLVEDNQQDSFLIEETLQEQGCIKKIYHVLNGAMAISFLKKEKPFEDAELPNLILMDINMPIMDGHEALQKIKSMDEFKHIPVIMLTSSSRKEDIVKSYRAQSSSYIVKPDDIFELESIATAIKNYWENTVSLPNK